MIQIAVHGADGRMGILVTELVASADDCELCGLITEDGRQQPAGSFHPDLPLLPQSKMAASLPRGCVVIDFSLAPALNGLLDQARELDAALVIGTTGFSPAQEELLQAFAAERTVVRAPNFSIGIPTLKMLLQLLARTLPGGFDAEQVETHHITKLDRPSGTAATLAADYHAVRGGDPVPTHSLRQGGVIGEHTWVFSDQEETLVLTHRAHSRQAFLRGLLPAVRFAAGHEPGLYDLGDVLAALGKDSGGSSQ